MKKNIYFNLIVSLIAVAFISTSQASEEDKFDFLAKKFPHLVEKSNKSFEKCSEETKHYIKLQNWKKNSNLSEQGILIENINKVLNVKVSECFESEEKFKLHNEQYICPLEKNHPKHGYFNIFFSRISKGSSMLEQILLSAQYIYQTIKDKGNGTTIFLGRTPCLVQVAFEEILKYENDKSVEYRHLNFSGHPDRLTKRESNFFSSETNIVRDIVSEEKLNHYFNYLDEKDILKSEKIFIVDMFGSGSSLNSFSGVLEAYYKKKDCKAPSLVFLNLTQDMNWQSNREGFFTFKHTSNISNHGILTLPSDERKNMKFFEIEAYGIPLSEFVMTYVLDEDMVQEFLVHGIQYPAQRWTKEHDEVRKEGAKYHKPFYEVLRKKFSFLIDLQKKLN